MYIVIYRRKGERNFYAIKSLASTKDAAQELCDEMMSYKASAGQQEYSFAEPRFVDI